LLALGHHLTGRG